jgi:ATP-binding cassette, subfamily F, member 3
LTRPLRVELAQIDKRLAALTEEKSETEAALSSADVAAGDIAELGRRLHHIGAETAMLEERWLELQDQLESMQSPAST